MTIGDQPKPLFWVGSSRKDLKGFGGAGVLEVVEDQEGNAFRAVYTV